jgi:hypothetical protein
LPLTSPECVEEVFSEVRRHEVLLRTSSSVVAT